MRPSTQMAPPDDEDDSEWDAVTHDTAFSAAIRFAFQNLNYIGSISYMLYCIMGNKLICLIYQQTYKLGK